MPEFQCAVASRERDDDLFATASQVRRWLLIEVRGAWGRDAVNDTALAEHVTPQWQQSLRAAGIRPIAIRRDLRKTAGDGETSGAAQMFFVETGHGPNRPGRIWHRTVTDLADVADVAVPTGEIPADDVESGPGSPGSGWDRHEGQLHLVCTHGRHDSCCATFGRPLVRHLRTSAVAESVWECSHVGGDRFAANLVVLPDGLYFGRVSADDADALLERLLRDELDLDHYRGRSTQSFEAQAAEQFLRRELGLTGIGDIVEIVRGDGLHHRMTLATGEVLSVTIARELVIAPTPLTCQGSPGAGSPVFHLVAITPV